MKLYYAPGACSLSPHIVSRELGIPVELKKVNNKDKTIEGGGDYRKVNPRGYVPALELDDGRALTEGPAIVQYLADRKPEAGLAPKAGTLERYRLQEWLNFLTSEVHKQFSPLFKPNTPEDYKAIAKENLAGRPRLQRVHRRAVGDEDARRRAHAAFFSRPSTCIASWTLGRAPTRLWNAARFGHLARSRPVGLVQLSSTNR